jgi:hypothetical protein
MEHADRDTEIALREDIILLRERLERVYKEAGHLEHELRRREGEYIAHRVAKVQWTDDLE